MKQPSILRFGTWGAGLLCLLLALPASASAQVFLQVSDDDSASGCGSFNPSVGADAGAVAFESTCDLLGDGTNEDGNREIFLRTAGGALKQLTRTSDCTSLAPSISSNGRRVAFDSDCDVVPAAPPFGNPDGNVEIFFYDDAGQGSLSQLTRSIDCDSLGASINDAGELVAFDSDCDFTGANLDANTEIFQVTRTGTVTQLTDVVSEFCDSTDASSNGDGTRLAFASDCDLTGDNEDFTLEIFRVTNLGVVTRLTFAPDDTCSSVLPSSSGNGGRVAFESDCDFTGGNGDGSEEIFLVEPGSDPTQLTADSGASGCASTEPAISANGARVTYAGFCNPGGVNPDASLEIFQVAPGEAPSVLTEGSACTSAAPAVGTAGDVVVFDSDCDHAGGNADGNSEILSSMLECVCGAPQSNALPPNASDALRILQGSVGLVGCPLCACDVDDSGAVRTVDALRVLRVAVGGVFTLDCPAA